MDHETHRVLEEICKHLHIPKIKSISRRSRLHTEASKELKHSPSSFRVSLLTPAPLSVIPSIFQQALRRHVQESKVPLASPTCAAQPAFSPECWGIVTKNTVLEMLPFTLQTLIFQAPYINQMKPVLLSHTKALLLQSCLSAPRQLNRKPYQILGLRRVLLPRAD